jgi:hypothetical protein
MADVFRLISTVNPIQRVLTAVIKVERSRPHRIVRSRADVIRNIAKPTPDFLGWHPGWPLLHTPYFGDPGPGERSLPDRDTVPNGLALGEDVVEIPIVGIYHDGAGRLLAMIIDEVPPIAWPIGTGRNEAGCRPQKSHQ